MQISTKGRYGLRAILELARQSGEKPVSTKEISQKQKISIPYLEQLFFRLKNMGYIKSVRGAQGGYFLARDPAQISVGEIIECLDGPLEFSDCRYSDDPSATCIGKENCLAIHFWEDLRNMIYNKIHNTSLADLLNYSQKRGLDFKEEIESEV